VHFLDRGDDALGDHVAAHDAAEDVDEDRLHVLVRQDQLERLGHALLVGAAAHVQEVGRFAALELDHVHRRHRKPGAVDHAADVAVHGHVVQVVLAGGHLGVVFLAHVAHRDQVGVAEVGVVVGVDLAVEHREIAVGEDRQRVELDQRQVLLVEQLVQPEHDLRQLAHLLGGQAQAEAHVAALVGLQALHVVDVEGLDLLGRLGGHLLDVHAALAGGDEGDRLRAAVDQHRQVQLLVDVRAFGDQHRVDRQRNAGRLVGLHLRAEHALGVLAHLVEAAGELDAAGLAAATGVDLGLDHPEVAGNGLGGVDRLFGRARNAPRRHRDAVVGEQLLGLVFVEVHVGVRAEEDRIARPGPGGQQAVRGRLFSPMHRRRAKSGYRRPAPGRSAPILRAAPAPTPPLPAPDAAPLDQSLSPARELYLFALYRVLVAALLALVVFSPAGALIGQMHLPQLARTVSTTYLAMSVLLLLHARRPAEVFTPHVVAGLSIDITVALLATHAMPGAGPGIALMLAFNLAAGSLFVSMPWSMAFASAATLALLAEYTWERVAPVPAYRPPAAALSGA